MAIKRKKCGAGRLLSRSVVTPRQVRALLPLLWREMRSGEFSLAKVRGWLRDRPELQGYRLPDGEQLLHLLQRVCRQQPKCQPLGPRLADPKESIGYTESLVGYSKTSSRGGHRVAWHTFEAYFKLRSVADRTSFRVERSTKVSKQAYHVKNKRAVHIPIRQNAKKRVSTRTVSVPLAILQPEGCKHSWTLIYLHGFSGSGTGYTPMPHYFAAGAVKVVLPTAPLRPVTCMNWCDWYENSQQWRQVKFRRWYDYLNDRGGRREDDLDVESLHETRQLIHAIVDAEAKQLEGRTDRIILGGKSQGCGTALDAMLTYPEKLGGFIGVVGHVLSCTPVTSVDEKPAGPLYFFHEPSDKIMRKDWIEPGIQKLRSAGHTVHAHTRKCPWGLGHFVGDVEGAWIREALRGIFVNSGEI